MPTLATNPANFRARLFKDLFSALVIPPVVLHILVLFFHIHLNGLWRAPLSILAILGWATSKGAYQSRRQRRLAEQLGARTVPCVVGKWPGNIDVLLKMMCTFKTSYVLDVYLQLFEEYQCTTLNLRILWADNVSTTRIYRMGAVSPSYASLEIHGFAQHWAVLLPLLCLPYRHLLEPCD